MKSKAKDTSHYKSTRRDESNALPIAMVQSLIAPETTNEVKQSDAFKHEKGKMLKLRIMLLIISIMKQHSLLPTKG